MIRNKYWKVTIQTCQTHVEGDGTGPAPPSLQSMLAFIDAEESTGGGFFNECWGDLSRVQFATHL